METLRFCLCCYLSLSPSLHAPTLCPAEERRHEDGGELDGGGQTESRSPATANGAARDFHHNKAGLELKNTNVSNFFQAAACTAPSDTECTECDTAGEAGKFENAACSVDNDRECSDCAPDCSAGTPEMVFGLDSFSNLGHWGRGQADRTPASGTCTRPAARHRYHSGNRHRQWCCSGFSLQRGRTRAKEH